jgi:hypothetical protein
MNRNRERSPKKTAFLTVAATHCRQAEHYLPLAGEIFNNRLFGWINLYYMG